MAAFGCSLRSVHATLSLALSKDPALRQVNGAVLLSALDQIAQERHSGSENREVVFLHMHDSLFRKAKALFQVNDIRSVESLIQSDIDEVCGVIRCNEAASAKSEARFKMFGASFGYDVSVHPDSDSYLVISNLWRSPPSMLERYRDDAFSGPFRFQFGYPPQMFEGRQSILRFQIALDQFLTELAIKQQERAEQELFRGWGNTLRAKSDLERLREKPIKYRRVLEDSGATVTFELVDVPSEDLVGQPRQIRQHGVTYVTGDVESVEGAKLILRVERLYSNDFPEQGELLIDRFAANAAIECQRRALDAVRYERALRTELKRFLVRPEMCSQPEEVGHIEFVQSEMDDIKKDSVKAALGTKDFLLVAGPPGTGKTTFIAELIIQTVRSNPHARILLTSQTHVALDNAVERLLGLQSGLKIVRVGRIEDPRISQTVKSLILENQMESWRKEVLTRGKAFLEKFAAENGISKRNAEIAVSLQTLISLEKSIAAVESLVRVRTEETTQLKQRDDSAQSAALEEVDAELNRLRGELLLLKRERRILHKRLGELDPITQELLDRPSTELEEWNKTFLPDTAENRRFRDMLQIQADWELRFGRGTEFHAALLTSAQVIAGTCVGIASVRAIQEVEFDLCIVDEASKATPTETLVPLSRSRRWIMVGDQRQLPPFVEQELEANDLLSKYDLSAEELKKTVFDRLHSLLPQSCRKALLVQYRMVREIGDLISECFYGGELRSSGRKHDSVLLDVLAKPVTWIDTSRIPHRFESQSGTARMNTCEVRVVTDLLAKLNRSAGMKKRTYTVAVLSGYVLQKGALECYRATSCTAPISHC
jgi:DNA polymerase III delta prime subunit